MTDAISPKEIRWTLISMLGLIILSSAMTAAAADIGGIDRSDVNFTAPEPSVDKDLRNNETLGESSTVSTQKLNEDLAIVGNYVNTKVINEHPSGSGTGVYPNRDSVEVEFFWNETLSGINLRPAQTQATVRELPVNATTKRTIYYGTEIGEDDITISAKLEEYDSSNGHNIQYGVTNYKINSLNEDKESFEIPVVSQAVSSASNAFGLMIAIFNGWSLIISQAGWASVFVVAPMTAMSLVVLNTTFKLAYLLASAIPLA